MALPYVECEHYQLIEGELVVTGGRTPWHQILVGNLLHAVHDYFEAHGGGMVVHAPLDVVLSRENVLHPDVLVIRDERRSIIRRENVQGAPDIAIEVVCEDTRHRDEVVKRRIYERYGVTEYWMVDAVRRSVMIIRDGVESAATDPITTPLLPTFALALRDVFSEEP
ncbi:MAG TPA: Uma2 family endonuclease [Thermoanaerobaculia bacterium]|nr:Uma2 family endonuclease [Thermoanaerobaculia bacterium]